MLGRRKGFTLVEMLAVVVVLALIVIIAVPAVIKSMEVAKKNSFVIQARKIVSVATSKRQSNEILNKINDGATPKLKDGKVEYYCYTFSYIGIDTGGKYHGTVAYYPELEEWKVKLGDGTYETKDGYISLESVVDYEGKIANVIFAVTDLDELDQC